MEQFWGKILHLPKGLGGNIDHVITKGQKTVFIETKLTIQELDDRIVNQLTNAVKKAIEADTVLLNVGRKATSAELARLQKALGDDVFKRIKIASTRSRGLGTI
jgi:pyruvate/2-oxoglutarate dehydrogenase complex dihydrolipoamide dehydrogenase (E3) component